MIRRASTTAIIAPPSPASSPRSYTQFHGAIHNSPELYTIPGSYTQFRAAIHNSLAPIHNSGNSGSPIHNSARFGPVRRDSGPPEAARRSGRPVARGPGEPAPYSAPFGSIRPHVVPYGPLRPHPVAGEPPGGTIRRAPGPAGRPAIHNSRAARRGGSLSYTQFPGAIHNSGQLYTIPGSYTQFRAPIHNSRRPYTIRRPVEARGGEPPQGGSVRRRPPSRDACRVTPSLARSGDTDFLRTRRRRRGSGAPP